MKQIINPLQPSLFAPAPPETSVRTVERTKTVTYPEKVGISVPKGKRVTSRMAAERLVETGTDEAHRQMVMNVLMRGDYTGSEIAGILNLEKTSVRPRLNGLFKQGLIDTIWQDGKKLKRENKKGNPELVWRLKR
jgi:hypothetical protein